ncbi:MAG TPA: hypothetical protein VHB99_02610, partial [Pirellulales bacterium]|nr:hypothetical protein [Pirellulales bacterium]
MSKFLQHTGWLTFCVLGLIGAGDSGWAQNIELRAPTVRGAERQVRNPFQAALLEEPSDSATPERLPPGLPDPYAKYEKAAPPADP